MKSRHGFHLIEVLTVLAIISILTALSMPLYNDYLRSEKRMEAANTLSQLALAMEKYHLENNTYKNVSLSALHFPQQIAKNHYELKIVSANDQQFMIAAMPLGKQRKDKQCKTLILNSNGEKNISGPGRIEECW